MFAGTELRLRSLSTLELILLRPASPCKPKEFPERSWGIQADKNIMGMLFAALRVFPVLLHKIVVCLDDSCGSSRIINWVLSSAVRVELVLHVIEVQKDLRVEFRRVVLPGSGWHTCFVLRRLEFPQVCEKDHGCPECSSTATGLEGVASQICE